MSAEGNTGLFQLVVVAGGAIIVYMCFVELPHALENRNWPKAEATVTNSAVVTEAAGNGGHRSFARIEFNYQVAGQLHQGRWEPRKSLGMWGRPESVTSNYPEGKTFAVYHAPDDPKVYVIQRGITVGFFVPLIVGLILVGFGLMKLKQVSGAQC